MLAASGFNTLPWHSPYVTRQFGLKPERQLTGSAGFYAGPTDSRFQHSVPAEGWSASSFVPVNLSGVRGTFTRVRKYHYIQPKWKDITIRAGRSRSSARASGPTISLSPS